MVSNGLLARKKLPKAEGDCKNGKPITQSLGGEDCTRKGRGGRIRTPPRTSLQLNRRGAWRGKKKARTARGIKKKCETSVKRNRIQQGEKKDVY